MNILTDNLPTTVAGYAINTDYKNWIAYETLLRDETLTMQDKLTEIILLTVREPLSVKPEDMERLFRGLILFHAGKTDTDEEEPESPSHGQERVPDAYDYDIDQELILAAFMQAYRIDLSTASMHWFVFRALLQGLPDDTRFMSVVGYRTADTSRMPKETAKQYNALKAKYAIRRERKPLTREEAEAALKAQVAEIYRRAEERKKRAADNQKGKG